MGTTESMTKMGTTKYFRYRGASPCGTVLAGSLFASQGGYYGLAGGLIAHL
jgi:hypothetical protein